MEGSVGRSVPYTGASFSEPPRRSVERSGAGDREPGRSQGDHHRQGARAWLRHLRGPARDRPGRRFHPRAGRGVPDPGPGPPVERGHRGHRGPRRGGRRRHPRPHRGRPAEGSHQRPGAHVPQGDRQGPAPHRRPGGRPRAAHRGRRIRHIAPGHPARGREAGAQSGQALRREGLGDPRPPAHGLRQGRGHRPREDREELTAPRPTTR